jgi:hypothetical protein
MTAIPEGRASTNSEKWGIGDIIGELMQLAIFGGAFALPTFAYMTRRNHALSQILAIAGYVCIAIFALAIIVNLITGLAYVARAIGSFVDRRAGAYRPWTLPRSAIFIAAGIGGTSRAGLHEAWLAHMEALEENWQQRDSEASRDGEMVYGRRRIERKIALGFLVGAIRMRCTDLAPESFAPMRWIAGTQTRLRVAWIIIAAPMMIYFLISDGMRVFLTIDIVGLGIVGSGVYALLHFLAADSWGAQPPLRSAGADQQSKDVVKVPDQGTSKISNPGRTETAPAD